jgi:large subunit ribosomal protein L18
MTVKVYGKGKVASQRRRHLRLRKRIKGTRDCPRLVAIRSNRYMTACIIDDSTGKTLVSSNSKKDAVTEKGKIAKSEKVGEVIAAKAKEQGISAVVFDRRGNKYSGRVAAVAKGARAGGLKF